MLTTGVITQVDISSENHFNNKYKVKIGIFLRPGDIDDKIAIRECNASISSGLNAPYKVGDPVYVDFLYDDYSHPIIVGKIYQGISETSSSYAFLEQLKVTDSVELPINTTIGNIKYDDLYQALISLQNQELLVPHYMHKIKTSISNKECKFTFTNQVKAAYEDKQELLKELFRIYDDFPITTYISDIGAIPPIITTYSKVVKEAKLLFLIFNPNSGNWENTGLKFTDSVSEI